MIIIGITGTIGAGKGTIVEYLQKKHHFQHFSVRSFLTEEIIKRGMIVNRDSMVNVANELRAKYNPSYIVGQLYELAYKSGQNCIIESIRTSGEVELLRQKPDFYLIAIDAEPKLRYSRIQGRMNETDNISYEEFLSNEQREMNSDDPNKQNISKCVAQADFVINNNSSINELEINIESLLTKIGVYGE